MDKEIKDLMSRVRDTDQLRACFCVGPKNGEPLCPCAMRAAARDRQSLEEQMIADGWTPPKRKPVKK